MNWAVPGWWVFVLLALAAYRTWRIFALDVILEKPREALLGRVKEHWREWIECPFCAGFWVTLAWWLAWCAWPHWTAVAAVPLALSAVVALVGARLDPE